MNKKDLIGKRVTWEELVEAFPDKWVALTQGEFDSSGCAISGVVLDIGDRDEINKYFAMLNRKKINIQVSLLRTTEFNPLNYIKEGEIEWPE